MKKIILIFSFFLSVFSAEAQEKLLINPVPQRVNFSGKNVSSQRFKSEKNDFKNVVFGLKTDKVLKKYAQKVPNKPQAYYILIEKNKIFVVGNDKQGEFYGLQTLRQLLQNETLSLGEISDYPDLLNRGVVEGFYGTPWSHQKRLNQLDFYGKNKLNVYIYGPKDDPYHSSPNWRLPYPEKQAEQIKELVLKANENFVDFVWAIHPGQDIQWNEKDRNHLISKFEMMYGLGVRAFAVFFDDISGEGTNPQKQAELLNFLHTNFVEKYSDVKPLIMCPTEYNKSWSDPNKKYLETLGKVLHPSIEIMWTGDRVVADVDKKSMQWINDKINRKAYIWWNFPVSDYVRDHLLMGAVYGNGLDIQEDMSGFVSNPMDKPEASKIAIYGVANYTWNMKNYNSQATWHSAIADILPQNKSSLLTFAQHNSDLGINGHRYRREESVAFKPIAEQFLTNFEKGLENPQLSLVETEFQKIISSAEILSKTSENQLFIEEIKPWIIQFGTLGKLSSEVMKMYQSFYKNDNSTFKNSYEKVKSFQKEMFENSQIFNQNPYQPGVKTGTLVVEPFVNQVLQKIVSFYNQKTDENLKIQTNFNPNSLITNILQIESVALQQRNKSVRISPVLEFISVKKGDFLGISLKEVSDIKTISVDLGNSQLFDNIEVEISDSGTHWKTLKGSIKGTRWVSSELLKNVKSVRVVSKSSSDFEFQLKQFEVEIQ